MMLGDGSIIWRDPKGSKVRLPTGEIVLGRPHDTDDYRATAARLGYGADTLAMCRDHDPLHAWLSDQFGVTSHALRVAAGVKADPALAAAEEEAVLAVQRWLNLAGKMERMPWR